MRKKKTGLQCKRVDFKRILLYRNVISQIFHDIPGVVSMFDDICDLIIGKTEKNLMKICLKQCKG